MCATCIESDDDTLMFQVDPDIFYARDFLQHRPKLMYTLITIFAFRCDFDRLHDRLIAVLGVERVGRIAIHWSCRVHGVYFAYNNVPHWGIGRVMRDSFRRVLM